MSIFTVGANLLTKHGKLDSLKQSLYTMPDNNGIALAIQNKHFKLVDWLVGIRKITPNFSYFIDLGNFEIIRI